MSCSVDAPREISRARASCLDRLTASLVRAFLQYFMTSLNLASVLAFSTEDNFLSACALIPIAMLLVCAIRAITGVIIVKSFFTLS